MLHPAKKSPKKRTKKSQSKQLERAPPGAQASWWAAELARLAAERGDARTGLEAEAYVASMAGALLLERHQPQKALASFSRAKCAPPRLLCTRCKLMYGAWGQVKLTSY